MGTVVVAGLCYDCLSVHDSSTSSLMFINLKYHVKLRDSSDQVYMFTDTEGEYVSCSCTATQSC